jgi:hypothetical protein
VRVYLQDRSYKSVRVTVENSAEDVTKTLRLKLGKDWYVAPPSLKLLPFCSTHVTSMLCCALARTGPQNMHCTNSRMRTSVW